MCSDSAVVCKKEKAEGDGSRAASTGIHQRLGRRNPNEVKPTGLTAEATDFPSSYLLASQRGPAAADTKG